MIERSSTLAITQMDDKIGNLTVLAGDDISDTLLPIVENMMRVFIVIHVIIHIDRLLHVFYRMYLPKPVHVKLSDVLPVLSSEVDYPFVAIQLPMMNEIECCESAIDSACNLDWPKIRLVIQVLDDSTDERTRKFIDKCVQKWIDRGIEINVYRREKRAGFKAGSLAYGMSFISHVEYIAIFDVDFLPTTDYLLRTVPTLIKEPTVAFVQARWTFTNSKETFLTRMQEIALNYHHKCEQECRFRASLFFTFNGTAGIWRKSAIEQIGGWHTDTLVEDLDLSLRAYLNGWRSVYMHDVECLSELPPTLSAYLNQQHRWTSGPMQVARKMGKSICLSKHISWDQKFYCLWYLFRSFTHFSNIFSLIVTMPLSILVMRENIYHLICIYLLIIPGLCHVAFTLDEIHLIFLNTLFLNGMSLDNCCATLSGLFNYGRAKKWIVTPKFGSGTQNNSLEAKSIEKELLKLKRDKDVLDALHNKNINESYFYRLSLSKQVIIDRLQWTYNRIRHKFRPFRFDKRNFSMAVYLMIISYLAFQRRAYLTGIYLFSTSIMYFVLALGYIGRHIEHLQPEL